MTTVRLDKQHFERGLKYARKVKGRYNPGPKTWTLPTTDEVKRMLEAPAAYGWVIEHQNATDCVRCDAVMAPLTEAEINRDWRHNGHDTPCVRCGTYCYGDCRH